MTTQPFTGADLESRVRSYCRSFPATFTNARESFIYDDRSNRYIDFLAGAGTLNYGHNPAPIKRKILEYISENGIVHALDMNTAVRNTFLHTFQDVILAPRGLRYKVQFPGPTGTNAVEAAIKLARKITGRKPVLSFKNGFHGMTSASVSVTANAYYHQVKNVPTRNPWFLPYDSANTKEALRQLNLSLSAYLADHEKPAAIIAEPIQGEGGIHVASDTWLRALADLCHTKGILLIMDDIQAGCGRGGRFFSFETSGIQPDFILLSKSIGGYGLPLSMVLIKPQWDQWEPGEYSGTFRSNNLSLLAATEAIHHYWRTPDFEKQIDSKSRLIHVSLKKLEAAHPDLIKDVRGKGMMWGLEFRQPDQAKAVSRIAFSRRLIIETSGDKNQVLKLLPPLTIEPNVLLDGIKIIEHSLTTLSEILQSETALNPEEVTL